MSGDLGEFSGRHVIVRNDTEILNGVFMSARTGALVVDFADNPQHYETGYRSLRLQLGLEGLDPSPLVVARVANQVVKEMVPFDEGWTRTVLRHEADRRGLERIGPTDEVELSRFVGGVRSRGVVHVITRHYSAPPYSVCSESGKISAVW